MDKPASADVNMVDSADPIGSAKGLLKKEFYGNVRRALGGDDGIVRHEYHRCARL